MKVKRILFIVALMVVSLGASAQVKTYLTIDPLPAGTIVGSTQAELTVTVYLNNGGSFSQTKPITLTNAGGSFNVTIPNLYQSNVNNVYETKYTLKIGSVSFQSSYYYLDFYQYATCSWGDDDIIDVIWH